MTQLVYHLLNKTEAHSKPMSHFRCSSLQKSSRLPDCDCCRKELPDGWGRVQGSVSEKDIFKI